MATPADSLSSKVSQGIPVADKYGFQCGVQQISASATFTSNQNFPDQDCSGYRRGMIVVDLTALTGTSVTFTFQEKDVVSGKYITMAASTAETGAKTVVFLIDESAQSLTAATGQELVFVRCFHNTIYRIVTSGTWSSATLSIGAYLRPQ